MQSPDIPHIQPAEAAARTAGIRPSMRRRFVSQRKQCRPSFLVPVVHRVRVRRAKITSSEADASRMSSRRQARSVPRKQSQDKRQTQAPQEGRRGGGPLGPAGTGSSTRRHAGSDPSQPFARGTTLEAADNNIDYNTIDEILLVRQKNEVQDSDRF